MKFDIQHKRVIIGNRITVTVTGEGSQLVGHVLTDFDGITIGNDPLVPPVKQYRRMWDKQGSAGPGREHTVRVSATDQNGNNEDAVEKWEDAS